jgi:hypothetical protein
MTSVDENPGMAIFGRGVRALEATNFDTEDDTQEFAYLQAAGGPAEELQSVVNTEIEVAAFIARPVRGVDKEGEEYRRVRTVIVTPDGKRYATQSAAVAQMMATLEQTKRGGKIYNPAVRFKVLFKDTRNGFKTIVLDPLPPKPATSAKGK